MAACAAAPTLALRPCPPPDRGRSPDLSGTHTDTPTDTQTDTLTETHANNLTDTDTHSDTALETHTETHTDSHPDAGFGLEALQIFVKTLSGRTLTLDVAPTDTVEAVKLQVLVRERIPPALQRLIRGGIQLADDRTLADCGVGSEATLFLGLRLRGGSSFSPPRTACAHGMPSLATPCFPFAV